MGLVETNFEISPLLFHSLDELTRLLEDVSRILRLLHLGADLLELTLGNGQQLAGDRAIAVREQVLDLLLLLFQVGEFSFELRARCRGGVRLYSLANALPSLELGQFLLQSLVLLLGLA